MIIKPKDGILLFRKHKKSKYKVDIHVEETDEDKSLMTGEVLSTNSKMYPKGTTIIFGKYASFQLTLQGEIYHFIDSEDIISTCDYREKK